MMLLLALLVTAEAFVTYNTDSGYTFEWCGTSLETGCECYNAGTSAFFFVEITFPQAT